MDFFYLGLAVSLVGFSSVEAKAHFNQHLEPLEFPQPRRLSAASSSARVQARADSPQAVLSNTASFDYLHDGEDGNVDSVFAATVDVASHWPIFLLEDIDAHIEDVSCSESNVQLVFESMDTMHNLKRLVESTGDFIIVTAHSGCDLEGERTAHRVTKATFDLNRQLATLEKTRCNWEEAFHSTQVSFSRRHHSSIRKRSHSLAKRQRPEPTTTGSPSETDLKFTPTISFPTVTATTPLASTATKSLDEHYSDKKIFPPDHPAANLFIPEGVTVSCKTCSLEGEIEITKGTFRVSDSNDLADISDTIAFFDHGSIEIVANKLAAQVQLGLDLQLSQPLLSLNMTLPTIPLTPFEIPGALAFGPLIEPHLSFSVTAVEEIGFSFGFNVSVPDNSNILINMTDFSSSSISGFDETTFHTLPFESTSPLLSLITSVTFTPQILLGISTAKGLVSGGIGAYMELPKLALNITQMSDVDEKCEPTSEDADSSLSSLFGNLTNFIPSVDINMGVLADFGVDIGNEPQSTAIQTAVATTGYSLPTQCLQFDADEKTFAVPTPTATPSSKAEGEKAAAGEGEKGGVGRVRPGMVSMWALGSFVLGLCFL